MELLDNISSDILKQITKLEEILKNADKEAVSTTSCEAPASQQNIKIKITLY